MHAFFHLPTTSQPFSLLSFVSFFPIPKMYIYRGSCEISSLHIKSLSIGELCYTLTFCHMPEVIKMGDRSFAKLLAFPGALFSHPLCYRGMSVRYKYFYDHSRGEQEGKSPLKCEKLHPRATSSFICLSKVE